MAFFPGLAYSPSSQPDLGESTELTSSIRPGSRREYLGTTSRSVVLVRVHRREPLSERTRRGA